MHQPKSSELLSNLDRGDSEKKEALALALAKLEDLSIGAVEEFDSYDGLEAGCLSCSGVKISTK